MTARVGTMSVDGTPISQADLARIQAEDDLHADQKRKAVRVVASAALDTDDCRTLLEMLGLDGDVALAARAEAGGLIAHPTATSTPKRPRKRRAA